MKNKFVFALTVIIIFLLACNLGTPASLTQTPSDRQPAASQIQSRPAPTPLPPIEVSFYHLRIEYSTTCDWTTLVIKNPEIILSTRVVEVSGNVTDAQALPSQLRLNQSIDDAKAGKRVAMTVDLALKSDAGSEPLQFRLDKGSLNESVVKVLLVNQGETRLITEMRHSDAPVSFKADLGVLQNVAPLQLQLRRLPKMLWAFYYVWYGDADWNRPILKDQPTPRYSSNDRANIARQIEAAQSAGIDGFIVSWFGPEFAYENGNFMTVLDVAQEKDFSIAIYLETLGDDGQPRDTQTLYDWLAFAISTYRDNPAFMKVDGKPVIAIWTSEALPLATWKDLFARLHEKGLDAFYIGKQYHLENLDVFNGIHDYGVTEMPDLPKTDAEIGHATRYYPLLADSPDFKLWAATIQPGVDDRLIPGRKGMFQDREDGNYYRSTFDAALQGDPDWIFITSWNEWWENTEIEPGELYGDQYLKLTREFADQWKGK